METEHALSCPGPAPIRRWSRCKAGVYVRVISERSSKEAILLGRGTELNEGGMAMTLFGLVEMAIGQLVTIEVTAEFEEEPVRVRGIVKNRACFTYGLEFVNKDDSDHQHLRKFHSVLTRLRSRGGLADRTV